MNAYRCVLSYERKYYITPQPFAVRICSCVPLVFPLIFVQICYQSSCGIVSKSYMSNKSGCVKYAVKDEEVYGSRMQQQQHSVRERYLRDLWCIVSLRRAQGCHQVPAGTPGKEHPQDTGKSAAKGGWALHLARNASALRKGKTNGESHQMRWLVMNY